MQAASSWDSPVCRDAASVVSAPRVVFSVDRGGDPFAGRPRLPCRLRHVLTRGRGEEVQAGLVLGKVGRAEIADGTPAGSERLGGSACTLGGLFQRRRRTSGQVELEAVIRPMATRKSPSASAATSST